MSTPIYVAEIENPFPEAPEYVMGWLSDEFGVAPILVSPAIEAMGAFDPSRHQFHSTALLSTLLDALDDPGAKILGITGVDLYIPVLTFVYGEAQLGGNAAIVSSYRLRNSFYGMKPDTAVTLTRLLKESLHELGHTTGLVHCDDYRCVMCSSTSVEEIDLKHEAYCASCRATVERAFADAV